MSNNLGSLQNRVLFLHKKSDFENNICMEKRNKLVCLIGFIVGFICGFLGAGGGLVLVPFLSNVLDKDEKVSRASSVFSILFLVVVASIFHIKEIKIDYLLTIKCIIGGLIGSYFGSKLLLKLNNKILNLLFIIFLIYSGIKMVV